MMKKRSLQYLLLIGAIVLLLLLAGALIPGFIFRFAENRLVEGEAARLFRILEDQEATLRAGVSELGKEIRLAHYETLCVAPDRLISEALPLLARRLDDRLVPAIFYVDSERRAMDIHCPGCTGEQREGLEAALAGPQIMAMLRNAVLTGTARASGRLGRDVHAAPAFLVAVPINTGGSRPETPPDSEKNEPKEAAPANDLAPAKARHAEFLLALVDLSRFLRRWHPKELGEGGEWWVVDSQDTVLFHPDPASSGLSLRDLPRQTEEIVELLKVAMQTGKHHDQVTRPGSRDETMIVAASRMRLGEVDLVSVVMQPLGPVLAHLSVVVRGLVVLVLLMFVLLLGVGNLWQRLKRQEITAEARAGMSRELEKMVEARTVELNFVTRTIKDLIDSIPSALVVLDRQLNVLLVNLSFYSIFSGRVVNLTGRNITELFSQDFSERLRKIMHTKEPLLDLEMRKYVEGHGEKVLLVNVLHLLGKRDRLLMVIDDISERKVLERQLIQAEKMSGLGTLMSGIAHEINNPLNAIAGMAQIILSRAENEEVKGDAQQILQYVKRVAEIVKELSRYSRSAQVLDTVSADVHQVIEGALKMVTHSRKLKDVQLDKHYAHDMPMIKINVVELEQVFINLLTNAVDALDDKEKKTAPEPFAKRIAIITGLHGKEFVQIVMQDNGPGIPPENVKKIFDPFFSTKEQGKGTGLGLSICYKIVQRYGGIILVETQPDTGTTFTIRLPINT